MIVRLAIGVVVLPIDNIVMLRILPVLLSRRIGL